MSFPCRFRLFCLLVRGIERRVYVRSMCRGKRFLLVVRRGIEGVRFVFSFCAFREFSFKVVERCFDLPYR